MDDSKLSKIKMIDEARRKRLLEEKQDRMIADMKKRDSTPVIKDSSLSTKDVHHIKSKSAPIDTKGVEKIISGSDFEDKISKLRALRSAGKKALGVLPLAGAGMAALSGDPAMAAEELAQDAMGPAGLAMEALRSEDAGNVEEEMEMLAEDKARKDYDKSPAKLDRLRALMGGKK